MHEASPPVRRILPALDKSPLLERVDELTRRGLRPSDALAEVEPGLLTPGSYSKERLGRVAVTGRALPSWPSQLEPQVHTVPSERTAIEC